MGISGCANMGCDIGGFVGGAPESELLLRWIQNGIFQPRFTLNSANNDNTVTQPYMYEEILKYVQDAFNLRYKMLPYLYSLMYEASVNGLPVMRPLFMEFPDDIKTYSDKNLTFMFGRSVLVANVIEKMNKNSDYREIYLPAGSTWYDINNNFAEYSGGQVIKIPVELSSVPMFLRGDGIFITSEDVKRILFDEIKNLNLTISAERDNEFTFYDDDGHSEDYKNGMYSKIKISVKSGERKIIKFTREGNYKNSIERINLKFVSKLKGAYWVSVDGKKIARYLVRDKFDESSEGWYYNLSDRTICVKCAMPENEIIISTEKFDLIGMTEE